MTRNQALKRIVAYFNSIDIIDEDLKRAVEIITEMKNGMPGKIWNDKDVRDAIDRFKKENGRYPKVKELDKIDYLPPHPVIYNLYGVTAGEWLFTEYGNEYNAKWAWQFASGIITKEDLINNFIEQFNEINPVSKIEYNKKRKHLSPSWQYTAQILGLKTWTELKKYCGVEYKDPKKHNTNFIVESSINGIKI